MTSAPPIDSDTPCGRCGYNLRGLPPDGQCPECGAAIAPSLTHWLAHADPRWRRKLAAGALLTAVAAPAIVLLSAIVIWQGMHMSRPGAVAMGVLLGLAILLNIVGCWSIAARDPRRLFDSRRDLPRRLSRLAALLAVALGLLDFQVFNIHASLALVWWWYLLPWLALALALGGTLGLAAQFHYLQILGHDIADSRLSKRARALKIGLPLSYASFIALSLASAVTSAYHKSYELVLVLVSLLPLVAMAIALYTVLYAVLAWSMFRYVLKGAPRPVPAS
ncbi:MAG: hypothetical protein ABR964_14500 [Tepidisphaeraceae bacterium]|jgi:hypothetical protein